MPRFFIEVCYKGSNYSGFQVQENADTIQSQVERALQIFYAHTIELTGASRTDAGVHAIQNYFHFDAAGNFLFKPEHIYNLNAILPADIVIKNITKVNDNDHCRFDAISRSYEYIIYGNKDPFLKEVAFFYPYPLDINLLNTAAGILLKYEDFTSFSKRNTQVNNFICRIDFSRWSVKDSRIIYEVTANRFLRGMVRGLVGTMLRVGSGKITINEFTEIIEKKDCSTADFSVPAHGLFLKKVSYPEKVLK